MAHVFLDMRCNPVRFLVMDGETVLCHGTAERQLPSRRDEPAEGGAVRKRSAVAQAKRGDRGEIAAILQQVADQAGVRVRTAHLIASMGDVTSGIHKLQSMSPSDMEKVIARKLAAELGEKEPIFSVTPLLSGPKSQACLVESISRDTVSQYVRSFSREKVQLLTISTSLGATLQAIDETTRQRPGAHAILDINRDFLELCYVANADLLHYERVVFAPDQDEDLQPETDDAGTAERAYRRWLFRVVNTIYTIHSGYLSGVAASPVERVWLCGQACNLDGIAEALKDSMDADVALADNLVNGIAIDHGGLALAGLARAVAAGCEVNLIPQDLLRGNRLTRDHLLGAVAAAAVAVMLTGGVYAELKHDRLTEQVAREKKEIATFRSAASEYQAYARNLDVLKKLTAGQPPFYGLFRELADRLPDGVYLEKMDYRQDGDSGLLKFTATTPFRPDIGRNRILSRLVAVVDTSGYLRRTADPLVAVTGKDKDRMIEITLECEVRPREAIR
jgi:hypothetical protein